MTFVMFAVTLMGVRVLDAKVVALLYPITDGFAAIHDSNLSRLFLGANQTIRFSYSWAAVEAQQ